MCPVRSDRRRSPRVFFLKNEEITFRLKKGGEKEARFPVLVKDLSLAGIGFILNRTESVAVRPGDRLIITDVHGAHATDFLIQSALHVEWVLDTNILDHVGFGCSFCELDETVKAKLENYFSAS